MSDWNKGPNSGDDDDLNFDWLNDDDASASDSSSERTGLTGKLSWQTGKSAGDALPNLDDDDLSFDWSTSGDTSSPGASDRTGLTGTLDWQKAMRGGASAEEDWQAELDNFAPTSTPLDTAEATDTLFDDELPADDMDALFDDELPADDNWQNEAAPFADVDDATWLDEMLGDDETAPAATPVQDIPDWLSGLDLPTAPDEAAITAHQIVTDAADDWEDAADLDGDGEPDWMHALPDDAPETADADLFADEDADAAWGTTYDEDVAWETDDNAVANPWAVDPQNDLEAYPQDEAFTAEPDPTDADVFDFDNLFADDADDSFAPAPAANDEFDLDALFGAEMAKAAPSAIDDIDALFGADNTDDMAYDELSEEAAPAADFDFGDDDTPYEIAESEFDFDAFTGDDEDPFAFTEQESLTATSPDWLDSLEEGDYFADEPDTAAAMMPEFDMAFEAEEDIEPEIDIDQLLANLDNQPVARTQVDGADLDALFGGDADEPTPVAKRAAADDLDHLFAEDDFASTGTFAADSDTFEVPEWLREAAASSEGTISAAGIIRQQKDRPLEDLDDRLLALRESGLSISTETSEDKDSEQRLKQVLLGIKEGLIPTTLPMTETGLDTGFRMTPDQTKQAQVLLALVGLATETSAAGETVTVSNRRDARPSLPIARVLITLMLLAAVLIPFFVPLNIGTPPPLAFSAGSDEEAAFNRIEALAPEAPVLVAIEYTPTGAAELDDLTQMLLTHILQRGARPILVGTQPVGLLHAESLLITIAGEAARNRAYYVASYLPGTTLGLRNLATNPQAIFDTDIRGLPTGLIIDDLDDFALIVIITENVDNLRNWMEQVAPSTQTSFIAASGFAAMPLIAPYANQRTDMPLLVGYQDAYTYNALLLGEAPPVIPTETATEQPTEALPLATAEIVATVATDENQTTPESVPTEAPTTVPRATLPPTNTPTPPPTATFTPLPPTATATDIPTLRPTVTPSPTLPPTHTPTFTSTPEPLIEVGTVGGTATINVRTGPGTSFGVVAQLQQGTQVRVLGYNDQRDWVQIQLPDGREAWIAAFLITIETMPESQFAPPASDSGSRQYPPNTTRALDGQTSARGNQAGWWRLHRPYPIIGRDQQTTPAPDATSAPTLLPTLSATPLPTAAAADALATPFFVEVVAQPLENRENRWQAMTLGILAAVVLITLGNLYYIMRGLLRR